MRFFVKQKDEKEIFSVFENLTFLSGRQHSQKREKESIRIKE